MQDGLDGRPRDDEGADVYRVGIDGRGYTHGAGHGGVRDDLALQVGLRHLVGGVVVVEAGGTDAPDLADAQVGNAVAPETQGLLRAADEDDLLRAALEGDGLGGEGAKHVDDDDRPVRAAGAFDEAVDEDAHQTGVLRVPELGVEVAALHLGQLEADVLLRAAYGRHVVGGDGVHDGADELFRGRGSGRDANVLDAIEPLVLQAHRGC